VLLLEGLRALVKAGFGFFKMVQGQAGRGGGVGVGETNSDGHLFAGAEVREWTLEVARGPDFEDYVGHGGNVGCV
jgi:hypothetical protein